MNDDFELPISPAAFLLADQLVQAGWKRGPDTTISHPRKPEFNVVLTPISDALFSPKLVEFLNEHNEQWVALLIGFLRANA